MQKGMGKRGCMYCPSVVVDVHVLIVRNSVLFCFAALSYFNCRSFCSRRYSIPIAPTPCAVLRSVGGSHRQPTNKVMHPTHEYLHTAVTVQPRTHNIL